MNENLLNIQGIGKSFDGIKALVDFSCVVNHNEIIGLIGPNGAGKTTIFNVISGLVNPEKGSILFEGKNLIGLPCHRIASFGISRTFQNLRLIRQLTVLENVLLSFGNQLGERLGVVFFQQKKVKNQEAINLKKAMSLLDEMGLVNEASTPAQDLSYGQQKLLSLVCCLATQGSLMLLDEPIAGIAPEMIDKLLEFIRGLPNKGISVILIEHNLDAVMQVCDRVIFMDTGVKVCEGTPYEVRNDPNVIEAFIG